MADTMAFKQVLVNTKNILEKDFSDAEIKDNMGDVDFANEFAENLFAALDELR